ncbi:MAG: site-specific integrase [Deltaproteobacteria bacterium]|nr:site-specific integrase [Deltaproteobacteria bacterium]
MGVYKSGNRWYVRFRYEGREIRRAGGRTQRQAKDTERRMRIQLDEGADPESLAGTKLFIVLADAYLNDPDTQSLGWYRRVKTITKRLSKTLGQLRLNRVNANAISEYKRERLQDGIKQSTLNRELAVLRRMLRWGSEHGFIHRSRIPVIRLAKENPRIVFLTQDDEERLLDNCLPWLRDLVIVALDTGCRLGELLDLQWKHVDLSSAKLTVATEKGGGSRTLYLTDRVIEVLESMPRGLPDVQVFKKPGGDHRVTTAGSAFKRAASKAKLSDDVTFHATRHTFATRQVEKGTNILILKELLGHKSLAMVMRYGHVQESDKRKAMLGVEENQK